jgi:ethanolamine utilization protein EutA
LKKIALSEDLRWFVMHDEYEEDFLDGLKGEEHDHPFWANERIELKSMGIDIGSSTSQIMFSRLVLRRLGTKLSSRFVVVDRKVIWRSEILLTPFLGKFHIDFERLSEFLNQAYQSAGLEPETIDTGVVIITGEASRKENAEVITAYFSTYAGKFVCATAGPNLEAMMAAYGCGAVRKSTEMGQDKMVMAVDVGGGTAKIALIKGGIVQETVALNIGGRLVAVDEADRAVRIEKAGEWIAEELGIELRLGKHLDLTEKQAIAARLADILFEAIDRNHLSPLAKKLMITTTLQYKGKIDAIMFSGGVGEYIYGIENRDYGDLGRMLGMKIVEHTKRADFVIPVEMSEERIRATVIGASQFTIQVSGNTIFISNKKILPIRNLKVIFPRVGYTDIFLTARHVTASIRRAFARVDLVEGEEPVALAFDCVLEPRYEILRCLAEGVVLALKETIQKGMPVVLVFNSDIGKSVGNLLRDELQISSDIVSFDQVHLHEFDYIDVGSMVEKVGAVPVVVKSLVFGKHAEEVSRDRKNKELCLQ